MSSTASDVEMLTETLRNTLIRDLVELYPEVMPVLTSRGMDICCGGGMTVPDAARAHQQDDSIMIDEMLRTIRGEGK